VIALGADIKKVEEGFLRTGVSLRHFLGGKTTAEIILVHRDIKNILIVECKSKVAAD
jgi:hypothetical protein